MSSESSFDAQVFNEFDDFVQKAHSTDYDSITSDPESPLATISFQGPFPPIPIHPSSQTSTPPPTPGISESFFKLDIALQDTDSLSSRRRRGRPFKRIYARRHTLGKTIAREDALVKQTDPIPKLQSKSRSNKFSKTHPLRGYTSKYRIPLYTYPRSVNLEHLGVILTRLHL